MGILSADRDGSWTTWFLVTTGPHPMGQVIEMAQLAMERWEVREELGAPAPAACSLPAHPCIHPCVAFLAVSTFSIIILNWAIDHLPQNPPLQRVQFSGSQCVREVVTTVWSQDPSSSWLEGRVPVSGASHAWPPVCLPSHSQSSGWLCDSQHSAESVNYWVGWKVCSNVMEKPEQTFWSTQCYRVAFAQWGLWHILKSKFVTPSHPSPAPKTGQAFRPGPFHMPERARDPDGCSSKY